MFYIIWIIFWLIIVCMGLYAMYKTYGYIEVNNTHEAYAWLAFTFLYTMLGSTMMGLGFGCLSVSN